MATPSIILRLLHNPGTNRVQMNVAGKRIQIGVCINEHRLVPPLKKMTGTFPAPIDPPGVSKNEILQNSGKWHHTHLNGKMDMGTHQAKRMDMVTKPLYSFLGKKAKPSPNLIIIENDLPCVAPKHEVVWCSRIEEICISEC